jgi:membrane-bound lytic murein transglycosylase D
MPPGYQEPTAPKNHLLNRNELKEMDLLHQLSYGDPPGHGGVTRQLEGITVPTDLPILLTPKVRAWLHYFTGPGRSAMLSWLTRLETYRSALEAELIECGLPKNLIYVPVIESGMMPEATSRIGAAGLWQFTPGTARSMGLRVDAWVDERRDSDKSTWAALSLLRTLYRHFGDWTLALTAYNAGGQSVDIALSKCAQRSFECISERNLISEQAVNFAPKIYAAALVGNNREYLQFSAVVKQTAMEAQVVVRVEAYWPLEMLAACAGSTTEKMERLNPALNRRGTPPKGYPMRIPREQGGIFEKCVAHASTARPNPGRQCIVMTGDTIAAIAQRHRVAPGVVAAFNHLTKEHPLYVGAMIWIPGAE